MADRYADSRPTPGVNLNKDASPQPDGWSSTDKNPGPGVSLSKDDGPVTLPGAQPLSHPQLAPPPAFAAPASWPSAAPAGPPPPVPGPRLDPGPPPQGTFPQRAPQLSPPAATGPAGGPPPPTRTTNGRKRGLLLAGVLAALVVIVVLILVVANSGGTKKTPVAQNIQSQPVAQSGQPTAQASGTNASSPGSASAPQSAATPSATPTPTSTPTSAPKPVSPLAQYQIQQQVGPEQGDCVDESFGEVQQFLQDEDSCSLTRSLYSGKVGGRPVTISVSTVSLGNPSDGHQLVSMSTRNGTGDVRTLVYDGEGYPGSPDTWASDPTFLARIDSQSDVEILEVMWADGGATHENNPRLMKLLEAIGPDVANQ